MNDNLRSYTKRNLAAHRINLSVTLYLLIATVVFFLVFFPLLAFNKIPIDYIALNPSNFLQGKYVWTLLTSVFMHAGFFHIFANMVSLIFVGGLVEKLLGKKRFFWFYVISGIFAGLFFILVAMLTRSGLNSYAVGASGALFALVGFLMVITPNLPVYILFIPIPVKMKYAAPLMLLALWLISIAPMAFGAQEIPIGNTAHLGGLVAGLIYAFYIKKKYKRKTALISKYFS